MNDNVDRLTAAFADRYAIERELGEGGMATDLNTGRKVALALADRVTAR